MSLLIFPVLVGKGRILRFLLGNPFMVIIGRLSFCMYLVHLMILIFDVSNIKNKEFFSSYYELDNSIICTIKSTVLGLLLSLFIEAPFM